MDNVDRIDIKPIQSINDDENFLNNLRDIMASSCGVPKELLYDIEKVKYADPIRTLNTPWERYIESIGKNVAR